MQDNNLLQRVYDATHDGLDIITDLLPAVDDAVIYLKKAFRLRPEERTPSAHLYPPDQKHPYWHVKDFGMSEGGGFFKPIDLYMWDRGYGQDLFRMALQELAERYGVQEQLSSSINKPDIEKREARADEIGAAPRVTLFDCLGGIDLSCWGSNVKAEHLETYGWKAVSEVAITYGDKVIVRRPTATYPIFAQQCDYVDEKGQPQAFYKVYEPLNPDKGYRFQYFPAGVKPAKYINGLRELIRAKDQFNAQEQREWESSHTEEEPYKSQKLKEAFICSGERDALCCRSLGYMPLWFNSETYHLAEDEVREIMKHVDVLYNIPDIDETGIRKGTELALRFIDIRTVWLPDWLGNYRDNRGKPRKDLRDWMELRHTKKEFKFLMQMAMPARFWKTTTNKKSGETRHTIDTACLYNFLKLNGFYTLHDDNTKDTRYVKIDGYIVRSVTPKDIREFVRQWVIDHDFRLLDDFFTISRTTDEDGRPHFSITINKVGSNLMGYFINSSRLFWRKEMETPFETQKDRQEYQQAHRFDIGGKSLTEVERSEQEQNLINKIFTMGYMLHHYKSPSRAWAPMAMDNKIGDEGECNGRSGKSFFFKVLSLLMKTVKLSGRNPKLMDNPHVFDQVTQHTQMLLIDDCDRYLNTGLFYDNITSDMTVNPKNNQSFTIPFDESPKIAFTTNYVPADFDPSSEARLLYMVFSDYYHQKTEDNDYLETRSIRDDFGKDLFNKTYSEDEWNQDLNFILQCVRFYLSVSQDTVKLLPPMNNIIYRKHKQDMGANFEDWAQVYFSPDAGRLDTFLPRAKVFEDFKANGGRVQGMTPQTFMKRTLFNLKSE